MESPGLAVRTMPPQIALAMRQQAFAAGNCEIVTGVRRLRTCPVQWRLCRARVI